MQETETAHTNTDELSDKDELHKEAYRISEATNDDGTVDVEIEDITKNGDEATIEFKTPWLETKEETMDWPKYVDENYKIVRICQETVGSFEAVQQLEGHSIRADPETWEIVTHEKPDEKIDFREKFASLAEWGLILTGFICILSIISMVVLALAFPFGVAILSLPQGVSVVVGAILLGFATVILHDEYYNDS